MRGGDGGGGVGMRSLLFVADGLTGQHLSARKKKDSSYVHPCHRAFVCLLLPLSFIQLVNNNLKEKGFTFYSRLF